MKLSVVIPVFNDAEFLEKCLEALSRQSRAADEIVVVDNNCTDDSVAIARQFGANVISEPQQGIWPAAYAGYMAAAGDIICRCDSDSVVPDDWLERIDKMFVANADVVAVTGPGDFYDASPWKARLWQWLYMKNYFWSVGLALGYSPLFGSNMAFKKEAWLAVVDEVHVGRNDIHDDIDLSVHLGKLDQMRIVYDDGLRVGISARPFECLLGMLARFRRGFRSIFIHWPERGPWQKRLGQS